MLNRMRLWVRSVVLRRRLEREMQEEMRLHLERATARLVHRGRSTDDARREAMREFGNVTSLQEQGRVARGGRWVDALAADSRFALRQYMRNPGATLAMLVVLAGGMSISTALFSFLRAYATQPPLGVQYRSDVVRIRGMQPTSEGQGVRRFSRAELEEHQRLTSHFSAVAGWANAGVAIQGGQGGERRGRAATATFVTDDYFSILGAQPVIGTALPPSAAGNGAPQLVAVIGQGIWETLYARSPDAIGATLMVDGLPVTIVGVAPPRFAGLNVFSELKLWLPLSAQPLLMPGTGPDAEIFGAVGRLQPGVSPTAASAAVQVVAARAAATARERQADQASATLGSADVVPLLASNGDPQFERDRRMLAAVFAALGLIVLLVTCTNVSALQTGLAMNRRREIAIRLSMGAGRARIVRQLLTESMLLAAVAGTAALGTVWVIQRVLMTRLPDMPLELRVSIPAALFTFGVALAVGIAFGLSPALHATRLTVATVLKNATAAIAAPRVRLQRVLVVAQIALTQPLIVGLAVMLFVLSSEYERLGLNEFSTQIVSLRMRPSAESQAATGADSVEARQRQHAEILRLRDRLGATPGVVGAVQDPRHSLTLEGYTVHPDDRIAGGIDQPLRLVAPMVFPGYFDVMGIPLTLGRDFAGADVGAAEGAAGGELPVVVGAHLARRLWPGASPLGRRLRPGPDAPRPAHTFAVVGVVDQPADAKREQSEGHRVYLPPDSARAASSPGLLIRSAGEGNALISTIRTIVREELPGMAITDLRTIADIEGEVRQGFMFIAMTLAAAGLLTLALAAIGLYAVVAFAVGQRTGEIAVRMAVGAHARQIIGRFIGDGLRLGAIGLAIGLPLSLMVVRTLLTADMLPSIPLLPVALIAAVGVVVVALTGTWIPARRAAAVDPAVVLRRE